MYIVVPVRLRQKLFKVYSPLSVLRNFRDFTRRRDTSEITVRALNKDKLK